MAPEEAGVEVTEGGEAQRGRFAAASVGFDVAADGGFHGFLLLWCSWYPSPCGGDILGVSEMDAMV